MTNDIRDARFYLVDESAEDADSEALQFEEAFAMAQSLQKNGRSIKILYTEEASQIEITRFMSQGIRATLVSGG
jgi:hypothetical protein